MTDIKLKPLSSRSPVTGEPYYELRESITFFYRGNKHLIPVGFVTDIATIPKVVKRWLPHRHPGWTKAAIIHDYLIARYKAVGEPFYTPWHIDKKFLQVMLETDKAPWYKIAIIYSGVFINTNILTKLGFKKFDYT